MRDDGSRYARVRLEEQEVRLLTITAETNCRAFRPGFKFTLTGYYRDDANKAYTHARHPAPGGQQHLYLARAAGGVRLPQHARSAFPQPSPYHPPRNARRPFIQGSQTAVVVGKSGEEIWVDQYGRVKVQFFWDRAGNMDENSSCWIRVAQLWAGKGWGAIFTPRIGQEVIVDFLEGDPDRPIITGRVYNADQTVPYTLPGEQTKSTIKSMSSKGGGGFNEIRLEDKKGSRADLHLRPEGRGYPDQERCQGMDRQRPQPDCDARPDGEGRPRQARQHRAATRSRRSAATTIWTIEGKEAIKITGSHSMR